MILLLVTVLPTLWGAWVLMFAPFLELPDGDAMTGIRSATGVISLTVVGGWAGLGALVAAACTVLLDKRGSLRKVGGVLLAFGWIAVSSAFPAVVIGGTVHEAAPSLTPDFSPWFAFWVVGAVSVVGGIAFWIWGAAVQRRAAIERDQAEPTTTSRSEI